MYTVYVLYSGKFDKIYIGMTSNLEQRFLSHNELSKKDWIKKYRPWEIIHKEEYISKNQAILREKELKSYKGREFIRKHILGKIQ